MKSICNKFIILVFSLFMTLNIMSVGALGANSAKVSADDVIAGESNLLVPINIKSSTKIMGFKISLTFDSNEVKVKGVSRGSITANGNFSTNYGVFESKFDVIWNNTTEVDANGTLFVLTLDTSETEKDCEINIDFSQPDTFNEAYEDTALVCSSIKICVTPQSSEQQESTTQETEEATTSSEENLKESPTTNQIEETVPAPPFAEGSQVADSVNNALDKENIDSIYDVEDKQEFVDSVNENLSILTGNSEEYYSDFKQLLVDYENYYTDGFIADIIVDADAPVIKDAIDSALTEVDADSIDDVKSKEKFIEIVQEKMQEINPDVKNISEHISEELAIKTIEKLYNTSQNTIDAFLGSTTQSEIQQNGNVNNLWIVTVILGICVLIGVLILFIKKKTRKQ